MAIQETSFPMEGAATPPAVMDPNRWRHQKSCSKRIPAGYLQLWFMFSWSSIWRILNHRGKGCQTCYCYVSALFRLAGSHRAVSGEPPMSPMHGVWVPSPLKEATCAQCVSISLFLPNNFRLGLPTWPLAIWEKWIWNVKWLIVSVNDVENVFS